MAGGYVFTYRYPGLALDPKPLSQKLVTAQATITAQGAYVKSEEALLFRAFQPDVNIHVTGLSKGETSFKIENVHPKATLLAVDSAPVKQTINGLNRTLTIETDVNTTISLMLSFPQKQHYTFGVLGDTGGNTELTWGLKRLAQVQVDFILHLGDGYYGPEEVGQVQKRFNASAVPVYATNGNHDFHGPNDLGIDTYLRNIGPLNNAFRLLNTCFINLETGGFMFPAHKGFRGPFLSAQVDALNSTDKNCKPVIFTHKPILADLNIDIPQVKHTLHGYDAKWIFAQLKKLNEPLVFAGHIHKDFEFMQQGVRTFVTGSGLAQDDLVKQRSVAKLLIGEFSADSPLSTRWISNEMPLEYHCSTKVRNSLLKKADNKKTEEKKYRYSALIEQ